MKFILNPETDELDAVGSTEGGGGSGDFLKLDQTVEQSVINGAPHFQGGIVIKSGQKIIFDGA